jgi:site-specific DNA recombinase
MARRNHGEGTKARRRHGRAPAALETVFGAGDVRRVAFYCRVSTEEQADRGTIQNQLHKLRQFAQVKEDEWRVVGEYIDDGCSGALWLENRPNGARLLSDARRGLLDVVVVYKLDRLARTLDALLDAHDALAELNVSIFSTQETFDTGTPAGKLVFQILGSIAEFERATILERTSIGRDRVAGQGRWIGGPVPFGYELDPDGKLAPSTRIVYAPQGASPVNEADMVRSIFARIADGSTLGAECHRLNALGIPTDRHYASGKARQKRKAVVWLPTVLRRIIHSPVYVGRSAYRASNGEVIERECPALVSHETWEQAHAQLARNRSHTDKDTKERYLLRGLIRCAECGGIYSGVTQRNRSGSTQQFYRCKNQLAVIRGTGNRAARQGRRPFPWSRTRCGRSAWT